MIKDNTIPENEVNKETSDKKNWNKEDTKTNESAKKKQLGNELISAVKEWSLILCAAVIIGCPLKRIFGLSCPGCGITRAYLCCFTGQFQRAFYYHPLFPLLPIVFLIYAFRSRIPKKILNVLGVIILVLYLGTYFYRIFVIHSTVTKFDFKESMIYTIYQFIKELVLFTE